ncbi:MAG: hypothetical protein C4517_12415 [Stygiobacter sp.]|nr:MAG: hypothetical protein C4517_12415 [Stygiobacter sp.]
MKKIIAVLLIALQIINFSCESTEPVRIDETIKLTAIDAAVVEIYLNVNVDNPSVTKEVVIERNGSRVLGIPASSTEIAVTDTGLTENTTYKYKAKLYEGGKVVGESSEISITTLKPSSHEFVWQTYQIGDITSTLFDVAIIDENNIWAVGEIYLKDSTGQIDPQAYNAAHWNGTKWEIRRIQFYTICGHDNKTAYPARSIISIENDVWITAGDQVARLEGNLQKEILCLPFSFLINNICGITSTDLYIVGNGGNIAHYDGKSWEKIESGTKVNLTDITGGSNGEDIFICGYNDFNPTIMLKYKEGKTEKIIESLDFLTNDPSKISGIIKSVWKKRGRLFTSTAYSLYSSGESTKGEGKAIWKGHYLDWGVESIRGNEINDIIGCGVFGKVWHYNGLSWRKYDELERQTDGLKRIEIKGNMCAAVGYRYINGIERYGLIHIGKRN